MLNHRFKILSTFIFILSMMIFTTNKSFAQTINIDTTINNEPLKFKPIALVVPAVLITYGVVGIESDYLKTLNIEVKEEVAEHIDRKVSIDDFYQYSPIVAVYGLNLLGVKGKNNFNNRTLILATSYLMMGVTVYSIKKIAKEERPDGSTKNSFPSGHTATAFMGAEFLWQEYKEVSPWYGIAGYLIAGGTGAFRIYNNRHWLTDVVAGAGIGILSTKAAYWLNPILRGKLLNKSDNSKNSYLITPFYNGSQFGANLLFRL